MLVDVIRIVIKKFSIDKIDLIDVILIKNESYRRI